MTLKIKTCHVVVCNGCGDEIENGDGFIPHFETPEAAQDFVDADGETTTTEDGRHFCASCNAADDDRTRALPRGKEASA